MRQSSMVKRARRDRDIMADEDMGVDHADPDIDIW